MKEYIFTLKNKTSGRSIDFKCVAESEKHARKHTKTLYKGLEITNMEINEGAKEYVVTLHENKGDKFTLFFRCMADDPDHAEEQALDMYPNAEIINVVYNYGFY